jgi:hypothetical protein
MRHILPAAADSTNGFELPTQQHSPPQLCSCSAATFRVRSGQSRLGNRSAIATSSRQSAGSRSSSRSISAMWLRGSCSACSHGDCLCHRTRASVLTSRSRNPSRCPPWMLLEPLREKRAAARSAADLILTRADEDQCDLTARLGAGGRDQLGYPETSKWSERPTPSTPDQPRSAAVPTSYRPSKPGPWPVFFPAITKQVVDLAIVPMMKIICRSKPSSWSRSGVASSRRNHHGLVSADQVRPRNALAVVRPESKIQDHHMTMILIAPTTSATTGRDVRGSTV